MSHIKCATLAALALVVVAAMFACPNKNAGNEDQTVLAKVNDRVLTPEDFAISIDLLYPPSERTQFASPEGKEQFMQQLVLMEMFYQEGVAQGYEEDPRIKRIVENYKRYIIYDTMMNRGVDEEAMTTYFRNNFVHVAIIFVKKPEGADPAQIEAAKAKAQKLRDQVAAGADFFETARKFSEHPSADPKFSGDIGAITRSTGWESEMVDAAMTMTESAPLSNVVESKTGFYIIKLLHPAGAVPLKYLTPEIRGAVYRYLIGQNYATYAAQLQSQAKVEIKKDVLDSIRLDKQMGVGGAPLQPVPEKGIPGVDPSAAPK